MSRSRKTPAQAYANFVIWVLSCGVVLLVLGYLPTVRLAGKAALPAMLCAVLAVSLGSIIGGYPVFAAHLRGVPNPQAGLVSMMVRLVAVVVLATLLALSLSLQSGPFLGWLAVSYLSLLVVDTRYATVALGRL
jgi:hypothetical protein